MATNFTYQGIPGYGTNPNSFTQLDQDRANYWNGGKQKDQLQLSQLYGDKFNMLNQQEVQRKNNELMLANNRKQLNSGIHQGVKQLMGGDNVSSWLKKGNKPKSAWQDPTNNPMWGQGKNLTLGSEAGRLAGTTIPLVTSADKWLPTGGTMGADPAMTFKMIDGKQHFLNPNYSAFMGSGVVKGLGSVGAWGAGAPSSIGSIAGTLINQFGGDNDPTTHTATEKIGTGLSWGSTAWKVAAAIPVVGPYIAPFVALGAALIGNKSASDKATEAKKKEDEAKKKYDDMMLEFRRASRGPSTIGGTKGANTNWWKSNWS
tara:strand:+ start:6732 stop:7679 length:948 start_codon:yes stop_codon:yes gene_type:complete